MFGSFIRKRRLELRITLRKFVIDLKIDPSKWSLIENERVAPPQEIDTLSMISNYLDVDFDILEKMAHEDKDIVFTPYEDAELIKHLPLIFPRKMSEDELTKFVEFMRQRI